MVFARPPPPKTLLGHHRLLSPTAALRVSPLCLGGMNFGDAWKGAMGECDKKTTFEILDFFYESGGNFVDTANNYQNGESEQWIGEWMEERGLRDQMVIATKFSNSFSGGNIQSNFGGNGTKSLRLSVDASLKKLRTTYIDILYVHWWDFTTSIPELMQSLNALITEGKILYIGASDVPAWVVTLANEYARQNALRPFCIYQGQWSAAQRDLEREILGMCAHEGMAVAPWGALGGGYFKTKAQIEQLSAEATTENSSSSNSRNTPGLATAKHARISLALEKIALSKASTPTSTTTTTNTTTSSDSNTTTTTTPPIPITSVALAYVLHKAPYVFPVIGGRKISHLHSNIEALSLRLSDEEIDEIEDSVEFDVGFPLSLLATAGTKGGWARSVKGPGDVALNKNFGTFDWVDGVKPILPA